jgi:hypothetical protein
MAGSSAPANFLLLLTPILTCQLAQRKSPKSMLKQIAELLKPSEGGCVAATIAPRARPFAVN